MRAGTQRVTVITTDTITTAAATATKSILIDFTQIALTATDQIHNRWTAQLRFIVIQMRIRAIVMADVAIQF